MPLRDILRNLRILQNFVDQEKLTQKLSESYPIRRAAQITAYFMQRGHEKVEEFKESEAAQRMRETARENMDKKKDATMNRVNNFFSNFFKELDEEWKKEKQNIEQKSLSGTASKETKDSQKKD